MKIIYSPKCLEYKEIGHPESPERVGESAVFLKQKNYSFFEPSQCSDEDILLVHDKNLINQVKTDTFLDPDTPTLDNIYSLIQYT